VSGGTAPRILNLECDTKLHNVTRY